MNLRRLLRRQEGITLIMAVGTLGILSFTGATLVYYSATNARSAEFSNDSTSAYDLAEAGINEMMAVLSRPENNALNKYLLGYQTDGSVVKTVHTYDAGTVEWYGTLDEAAATWSLTSIGKIKNPTGQISEVKRTLTAKVPVTPVVTQPLNNPSWNYIMSTQVTGGDCDMTIGNDVEVRTNLFVFGNLCLQNTAKILDGEVHDTAVAVKGKVTQYQSANTIGTSTASINSVSVGNGCKWFNNAFYNPCQTGANTKIYATSFSTTPALLVAPIADFGAWYLNANPGPHYACTTQSGTVPTWDTDAVPLPTPDLSKRNNSVTSVFNLTPTSSYSCRSAVGELTWDATTKVLTVSGTMYIDGDISVQRSAPTLVQYNGQATIYVSGSVKIKNVKLCGGISGTECDFAAWDPNSEMLVFAADGHNRQAEVATNIGIRMLSSQLQGALYATYKVEIDSFSKVDGPVVGSEVILGQSVNTNDFPTIITVPAGMPGEPTVYAQPNPPQLYSG